MCRLTLANWSTSVQTELSNMAQNTGFTIPLHVVTKVIAESLPDDATVVVEQDLIKALARSTHLFILYSTTRANEIASEHHRRTIHSRDVLEAVESLGFDHLIPRLVRFHNKYMEQKLLKNMPPKEEAQRDVKNEDMELEIITENHMNAGFAEEPYSPRAPAYSPHYTTNE